jgi:NAD(P)-dependent dehydrogenase (short-subunit alcohol dehydrogenase family)
VSSHWLFRRRCRPVFGLYKMINGKETLRILIIGASKGIGLETTRQALAAGFFVRALARSAARMLLSDRNLEKVSGNALKHRDVEGALVGMDVVIQALGVGLGDLFRPIHLFSDATRVLIAAMRAKASNV